MSHSGRRIILLTGATGYVGGRLLDRLETTSSLQVRCLTRRPEALAGRTATETELVRGDAIDARSLSRAMRGVDTAYYLIHSMAARGDFETLDRAAARNFALAARDAGVARIVYLGGLGKGADLSVHLASRQEVGDILRASGVATVEFRASIVIGSGSASYETVRALVEGLPLMITPRWANTATQPIAIEDLLDYLLAALDVRGSAIFEVGGCDRVSYPEVMREYARQRRLRRRLVAVPLLPPTASRFLLSVLAPAHRHVVGAMVESLRNETVVDSADASATFAITPRSLGEAIARALAMEDRQFAETRWSDALAPGRPLRWSGLTYGRRLVSSRVARVDRPPACAFDPVRRIGGETGWYATGWFWRARGVLDTLRGGVGLRRGRRDQVDLRVGDAVDFWRVERVEEDRLVRLVAEMKLPGRLWLQFEVAPREDGGADLRQTTVFDPAGYIGLAYWYLLCPIHHMVFSRMLRGVARAVRLPAETAASM